MGSYIVKNNKYIVNNNKDNDVITIMILTKSNSTVGFKIKHSIDNYNWDMETLYK